LGVTLSPLQAGPWLSGYGLILIFMLNVQY